MKKYVLSIVTILAVYSYLGALYSDIRKDFKREMYERQIGLMTQNSYYAFVEPYLHQAEATLEVIRYYKAHDCADELFKKYMSCLLNYNVFTFHHYISPSDPYIAYCLEQTKKALSAIINAIKQQHIPNLDETHELEATVALFENANQKYYRKLGIIKRSLVRLAY